MRRKTVGVRQKYNRTKICGSYRGDNGMFGFSWDGCEYLKQAKLWATFESQGAAN